MDRKKVLKKFDIIFWSIIFVVAIFETYTSFANGSTNLHFESITPTSGLIDYFIMSISMLFTFLFFIFVSLLKMFYLTIFYFGIKIACKKYIQEQLDISDFKDNSYYRDILSAYSPGVLSYIDDFNLTDRDIVATLMSLELKKKIKIEDNIEIIDISSDLLEENEKYILDCIKNNTVKNIDRMTFEKKVIDDSINDSLLEEKVTIKKKIYIKILINIFIYILISVFFKFLPSIFNNLQININFLTFFIISIIFILFFAMCLYPFTTIIYIYSYSFMNRLNPYVRSKKAKDINNKFKGLKNYVKDYSLLKERKYSDMILWKNYLIYSVISGQNDEIVNDIMKKIK